jgi:hypothetical protein
MSWTNIPNANLAIGAPIRSIDQLALRDNPIAIAEGATGAPRVRAEALNGGQSGSAPIYAARAWVNFDGTTAGANPAPMTIRASGNVSSVTRTATGDFTINFTTSMPDTNYSSVGVSEGTVEQISVSIKSGQTTSALQINVIRFSAGSNVKTNPATACVVVFR